MMAVKPEIVVCLGATAAQALLGRDYRLTKERGTFRSRADGRENYLDDSSLGGAAGARRRA